MIPTSKHTPTRWVVNPVDDAIIMPEDGGNLDWIAYLYGSPKERKELGNRIVTAVNAHEALLEAAKAALDFMTLNCGIETSPLKEEIRAAIALAEGTGR